MIFITSLYRARAAVKSGVEGASPVTAVRLLMGRETDLPYNRPPCSKGYLQGKESREDTLFRPPEWYEEQQVEALTKVSVMKLDLEARTAQLSNRDVVTFDNTLLAEMK